VTGVALLHPAWPVCDRLSLEENTSELDLLTNSVSPVLFCASVWIGSAELTWSVPHKDTGVIGRGHV
jgi:hypothetical protein